MKTPRGGFESLFGVNFSFFPFVESTQLTRQLNQEINFFLIFGLSCCHTACQLATPLQQRRIQVVRSNKVARKRLTESNGTPAMDFGCEEIRKRRYTQTKNRTQHTNAIVMLVD